MRKKQYELWKGYEVIAKGTIEEIAKQTGVKPKSIKFYGTPTYQKRTKGDKVRMLISIDDEEMGSDDYERY